MRLTDTIKSSDDLQKQYRDSSNLSARIAIYRFSVGEGFGPVWVFDRILESIPADADVMELGCGPAGLWKKNLVRVPPSWRILLTDLMPGMLEEASSALGGDTRFRMRQMDAHKLDVPDASFDAVIANHMLYHLDDRPSALREICRVLKPGGKLISSTNSEGHMREMRLLLDEFLGDNSPLKGEMPFSLENGEAQLRLFFGKVCAHRIRNQLRVTEVDAVVQYVLSAGDAKEIVVGERLDALNRRVHDEIESKGAFVFPTDAGLFVSTKT